MRSAFSEDHSDGWGGLSVRDTDRSMLRSSESVQQATFAVVEHVLVVQHVYRLDVSFRFRDALEDEQVSVVVGDYWWIDWHRSRSDRMVEYLLCRRPATRAITSGNLTSRTTAL